MQLKRLKQHNDGRPHVSYRLINQWFTFLQQLSISIKRVSVHRLLFDRVYAVGIATNVGRERRTIRSISYREVSHQLKNSNSGEKSRVIVSCIFVDDSEVSENVNLYSHEVCNTHTEVVSSLSRPLGGQKSIHVEHFSVARIQRRTGSAEGELVCVRFMNFFIVVFVR